MESLNPDRTLHEYREAALTAVDFDRYSRLVSSLLHTDVGAVTFLDDKSQFVLAETTAHGVQVLPKVIDRGESVCQYTVLQQEEAFAVSDLPRDPRFKNLPCVISGPRFQSYAGYPVKTREGFNIGAVCALDAKPRQWTDSELVILQDLARMITNDLSLHFQTQAVLSAHRMQSSIVTFMQQSEGILRSTAVDTTHDNNITPVKITQLATKILRETLEVDTVYILRIDSRTRQGIGTGIGTQVIGFASICEPPLQQGPIFTTEPFCSAMRSNQATGIYLAGRLPPEIRGSSSDAAQAIVISSWPVTEGLAGGMIVAKTTSENRVFREPEMKYIEALSATLVLELQKDRVVDADRVKTEFISSLSHELRTPLHGLLHNTEVLLETKLDAEQRELLNEIAVCGNAQLDIVESMLELHTARDRTEEHESLDVADHVDIVELVEGVVQGAMEKMRRTRRLQKTPAAHVQVVIDCPVLAHETHMRKRITHRKALQQILGHLVANSLKWTQNGYIRLAIDLGHAQQNDKSEVNISVCDTGTGIENTFLKTKLFQSFSKEDSFSSGLGIGLSVVAELVRQLHGGIEMESEKGAFTNIKLTLPMELAIKDNAPRLTNSSPAATIGLLTTIGSSSVGEQLLVDVLRRDLRNLGYTVTDVSEVQHCDDAAILITTRTETVSKKPIIYVGENNTGKTISHTGQEYLLHPFYGLHKLEDILSDIVGDAEQHQESIVDKPLEQSHSNGRKRGHSPESPSVSRNRLRKDFPVTTNSNEQSDRESIAGTNPSTPERHVKSTIIRSMSPVSSALRGEEHVRFPLQSHGQTQSQPRVLIVEDNPLNARLLVRFMEKRGYEYEAVSNGQEAVNAVKILRDSQQMAYDIILMDIQMPVLDGLQATHKIRGLESSSALTPLSYIVACTGLSAMEDKRKAAEVGCNHFLTKPISLLTLKELFTDWGRRKLKQTFM